MHRVSGTTLQDISLVSDGYLAILAATLAEMLISWPRRCDIASTRNEGDKTLAKAVYNVASMSALATTALRYWRVLGLCMRRRGVQLSG